MAHHFPSGAAQAVGRFFQHRRRYLKHIAHHRGDKRNNHNRQNQAGGKHADAHGRALKQHADQRQIAEIFDEKRLDIIGKHRRKHKQAPHAVDNRGNARQKLHRNAQRPAQKCRAQFGEKHGNAEAHRHGNQQSDGRGNQSAVDGGECAVLALHRIPIGRRKKTEAEFAHAGQSADHQRNQNAAEAGQHQKGKQTGGADK